MDKIIEIKNVSYAYESEEDSVQAVKNLSLDIYEGEFFVLLGPNGCGKSTLAKLINGFLTQDQGQILVNNLDSADENNIFKIRQSVGLVFQNPDNQMVASIIEDDIAFGCENLGIDKDETRRRVDWALKTVNMYDYKNGTPFKLSGGQKQRVAIAAILAMMPKVLILDESTSMLDPEGRKEVLSTISKLNKENKMTIILITHYMDEALLADRIGVMNNGNLTNIGTPKEIFGNPDILNNNSLELPISCDISYSLIKQNILNNIYLNDEDLVEAICRLK
ncbi:MAG: energy-coupling factor transporter ATPase [Clostridia bacterium]|nr:energy-coupling factor transporter ATPase [Clostridia bacterium]